MRRITLALTLVSVSFMSFSQAFAGRYYGPAEGRFLTPDPMMDKYPSLSPYVYAANNPLMYIDPDGKQLELSGNEDDIERFTNTANNALGGFYTVSVDQKTNVVSVAATDQQGPMTEAQQGFYDALMTAADPNVSTVSISLTSGSEQVVGGNFALEQIDMTDLAAFGDGPLATSAGVLGHEIAEQAGKQLNNQNYQTAHSIAIGYENRINGTTRTGETPDPNIQEPSPGVFTGKHFIHYRTANKNKTATLILNRNNIKKVKQ